MKKIKLLVDWDNGKVVTEDELRARKEKLVPDRLKDYHTLKDWLCDMTSLVDLFEMNEEERKELRAKYESYVEQVVLEDIMDDLEWVEISPEGIEIVED